MMRSAPPPSETITGSRSWGRSRTNEFKDGRRDESLHIKSVPPKMSYCPRAAQDNNNTLSQLSNIIYSIAMGLAPRITEFPGFCKNANGNCPALLELEHKFKDYEEAFYAKRGEKHSKPYAIAAVLSAYIWDSIQEYRVFTDEAATDLKVIAGLDDSKTIQPKIDEEVYVARMVRDHGAGGELKQDSKAVSKVTKEMRLLYKHFFKEHDEEGKRLIVVELGKYVWNYAMELKNQKGRIEITFDPEDKTSQYNTRLYRNGLKVEYYDERSNSSLDSNRDTQAGPQSRPSILWFPEVAVQGRHPSLGYERAVIFKARYGRDLGRLIERGQLMEQALGVRNSEETGSVEVPRSRSLSVGGRVAQQRGNPLPPLQVHRENEITLGNRQVRVDNDPVPGIPKSPRGVTLRNDKSTMPSSPNTTRAQNAAEAPRTTTSKRSGQGGFLSKVLRLILRLFSKSPATPIQRRHTEPAPSRAPHGPPRRTRTTMS